jgi:hypothetical protein
VSPVVTLRDLHFLRLEKHGIPVIRLLTLIASRALMPSTPVRVGHRQTYVVNRSTVQSGTNPRDYLVTYLLLHETYTPFWWPGPGGLPGTHVGQEMAEMTDTSPGATSGRDSPEDWNHNTHFLDSTCTKRPAGPAWFFDAFYNNLQCCPGQTF